MRKPNCFCRVLVYFLSNFKTACANCVTGSFTHKNRKLCHIFSRPHITAVFVTADYASAVFVFKLYDNENKQFSTTVMC